MSDRGASADKLGDQALGMVSPRYLHAPDGDASVKLEPSPLSIGSYFFRFSRNDVSKMGALGGPRMRKLRISDYFYGHI